MCFRESQHLGLRLTGIAASNKESTQMYARASVTLALLTTLALSACQDSAPDPLPTGPTPTAKAISSQGGTTWYGPYECKNLQIYVAELPASGAVEPVPAFLTLDHAIDQKLVRVTEVGAQAEEGQGSAPSPSVNPGSQAASGSTQGPRRQANLESSHVNLSGFSNGTGSDGATVNTLKIQNLGDKPIFVQQGDVVKGGKQDRVIAADFVVPPKSQPMDIAAFCVEHGRWAQRATLASGAFGFSSFGNPGPMNSRYVSSNSLKLALKSGDQNAVWSSVKSLKSGLSRNLERPEQLDETSSPSSFVLMSESATVQDGIKVYLDALGKAVSQHPQACGFALAINGRMNSIDLYPSSALFQGHSAKLLHAAATEAISIADREKRTMGAIDPHTLLSKARTSECKREKSGAIEHSTWVSETAFLTETRHQGKLLHVNWVAILTPPIPAKQR